MGIKIELPFAHRRALNKVLAAGGARWPRLKAGEWIRTLRASLRMTQAQLAVRAKMTQQHLALIESGKVDPRLSTLEAVFEALFCELVVLPAPRKRPGELVAQKTAEAGLLLPSSRIWDTM